MIVLGLILAVIGLGSNPSIAKGFDCSPITTLTYHHIQPINGLKDRSEIKLSVSPDVFSQQLEMLVNYGYEFIDMEKLEKNLRVREVTSNKAIHLTFDDGYEDLYYYLFPIIKAKKVPITIFLITGLVGVPGYLTWEQIREMAESGLVYFGNHTWSHAYINEKNIYQKEMEISERQLWEKDLNVLGVFAYPYGSTSKLKQEVLIEAGIRLAFTTKRPTVKWCQNLLDIPRITMGQGDPKDYGL